MRDERQRRAPTTRAQHMTLARTYLEMGMLDEAIASLEDGGRGRRAHRFEAMALLGRLYAATAATARSHRMAGARGRGAGADGRTRAERCSTTSA